MLSRGHLPGPNAAAARLAGAAALAMGVVSLIGWISGIQSLTSVIPGAVEMKFNTALATVCCAASLIIYTGRPSIPLQRLARALGLLAAAIGLATLTEYVFDWNLRIDELFMRDRHGAFNAFRGRMSPLSTVAFISTGLSLAALAHARLRFAVTLGAFLTVGVAGVSLLGYLWNVGELVTDRWLPPVALNTASCFLLIGASILALPQASDDSSLADSPELASVEFKILLGFVLAFSLLLVGGGYTYRTNVLFAESAQWVARTQEIRTGLAALYGSLAAAELAQRDYVIAGDPARRADYERVAVDVQSRLEEIRRLLSGNAVQQRNLSALKALVDARLQGIALALDAYARFGLPAARAVMAVGRKLSTSEQVRAQVERMDAVEARALEERQGAAAEVRRGTLVSLLVTLAVASAVFVALFRAIHREMTGRRRTEVNLLETNRFLDSLIESLPVMIVLKDAESLAIVRHNRAFESVLGFSSGEIHGKSAHQLFSKEQAQFITAKDREALASGGLVEIPEQTIDTRHSGARVFHTLKMPIGERGGQAQYLLAISIDITERKLAETAIRELNSALLSKASQLEASNGELESFTYSVSHDLRAPLRAVDGFALMMAEDYDDRLDAEGRRYLAVIRENSRRMGLLIDDLLSFSRLGRQAIHAREVNVELLVHEVIEEVLLGHDAARPQIAVGALPPVHGDRALLKQVWANLLSNAVKYSGRAARPEIEVSGRSDDTENCYSVRDNGVGFDMEYAGKLFGVFQRLHRQDEFDGTGVGLAIVHRVVTKHGGRVWAEGKVNQGATFSFALPAGAVDG